MSTLPPEFALLGSTEALKEGPWSLENPRTWFLASVPTAVLAMALNFSPFVALTALFLAMAVGLILTDEKRKARIPIAVNANHPWVLQEPLGRAEVMVRDEENAWHALGEVRVRLGTDPLLELPQVLVDEDPFPLVCRWPHAAPRTLQRCIVLLNHALALRDAVNGHDEEAEEQRRREAAETDLLERAWPEPETALEEGSALARWLDAGRNEGA